MAGIYIAALVVAIVGVLVLWWARACFRGTLRRNAVIGYRTPLTLRDDAAWKTVHRAIAPFLFVAGAGPVLGAALAAALALAGAETAAQGSLAGSAGWIILWVVLAIIPGHLRARSYKKALGPSARAALSQTEN
ncbi:MAG: SdpI family protein [Actinobacteria bacterium]|nr:SdpI family protein [Actinomycetota bacterium]